MTKAAEDWNQQLVLGTGTTDYEIMWKQLKKHYVEREEILRAAATTSSGNYTYMLLTWTEILLDMISHLEAGGSIV